jgi:3-isopropylmalate dehydratase small subunit
MPVKIDLSAGKITLGDDSYPVEMPEAARRSLVSGTWDSTAALLVGEEGIGATVARIPYLQWRRKS